MTVGELVSAWIDSNGMSQREFARKIGSSQAYVQKLCHGGVSYPTLNLAKKMCDVMGITLDEMWSKVSH